MQSEFDTQQTEIMGRNRLVNELIAAGIEVSIPIRDRGIDVIAYLDRDEELGRFIAAPIQMKASTRPRFGVAQKYRRTNDIILAFVWNVGRPGEEDIYAMRYAEAVTIVESMGWADSDSWQVKGGYSSRASKRLMHHLEKHIMDRAKWLTLIRQVATTAR
jgi:hypothetical protein